MSARRTTGIECAELAAIAHGIADEAAAMVMSGFRSRPLAGRKGQHDLVTEFDRASEDLVLDRLAARTPHIPVVAEEHTEGFTEWRAGLVWYVDPLDGTTNFVHGHPFWCVSIGLMEDDVPIVGAVTAPALGLRWAAWVTPDGLGSYALRDRMPCNVSDTASLADAMVATGFPPSRDQAPDNNFDAFIAVKRAAQAVRRCGSAAIDLCLVGDGTYDAYWERRLHAWDVVAGSVMVLAGGGKVTALDGGAPDYHVGHVVASNGRVHQELVDALNR